jgi:multiple sugar transport system substrate-binding protein
MAALTFTFWGSTFEKQAIEDAITTFNESHPCIRVTGQHTPSNAYAEKLSTMVAAGIPPDVAYLGESLAFPWAEEGEILDLTPYFAEQPEDESLLETTYYRFDDGEKIMGTGLATGIMLLYHNKALFDDAGVEYPPTSADNAWTWEEFVEAAKKLTKDRRGNDATSPDFDADNIDIYGIAFPQWWGGWLPFVLSNGGNIASEDGTEFILNQPEAVEALQAMQDLIYVHHVAPSPAQSEALPAADIMMQSRKVAMSIDGMWKVADFSQLGFDWGMGVLPYFDDPVTIVLSAPKVIFAATEHPDEAFEFYTYISDPVQNDLFTGGLWSPLEERYFTDPEYTAIWLEGQPGVYPPEAREVLVDYTLNNAPYQPAAYWLRNIGQINSEAINPAMSLIWTGQATAQEAMDEAAENAAPLLQGRW